MTLKSHNKRSSIQWWEIHNYLTDYFYNFYNIKTDVGKFPQHTNKETLKSK